MYRLPGMMIIVFWSIKAKGPFSFKKRASVLFGIANGQYSAEHRDWDNREVSPSISDQSGSVPSLRALFIMFNGVNTFPIKIQGGQRAFFSWRCNYLFMRGGTIITRSYTNIIMSICTSLQRLLPIVLILARSGISHIPLKTFSFFYFLKRTKRKKKCNYCDL